MSKPVLGLSFGKKLFAHCSMEGRVLKIFQKIKKIRSSIIAQNRSQKCANVFSTCFGANLSKIFFCPVFPGGSGFRKFPKNRKNSKFQKCPKSFPKVSTGVLNMLWGNFSDFFCRVFDVGLFSFSGFKNVSSVLQHTTQQTFFFHLRHSQYTQSHFRFSGLKILGSDSRTWKQKFSFPDLKIWVQFYDTTLNRHFFCIHATVNIRNSTSDVLDIKLWVQIPELKNMSSVFRTWKIWVQFSGLELWGRDLEKIKRKNQKNFKVPEMSKDIPKCPSVFWGEFFEIFFDQCSIESFRKKIKENSKLQKSPELFPKLSTRVLNMLWGDFSEFFLPSFQCRAFQIFWTENFGFRFPNLKTKL